MITDVAVVLETELTFITASLQFVVMKSLLTLQSQKNIFMFSATSVLLWCYLNASWSWNLKNKEKIDNLNPLSTLAGYLFLKLIKPIMFQVTEQINVDQIWEHFLWDSSLLTPDRLWFALLNSCLASASLSDQSDSLKINRKLKNKQIINCSYHWPNLVQKNIRMF